MRLFRDPLFECRELGIPHEESPTLPVLTASMGIATMNPTRDDEIGQLLELADSRLYEAKQNGRIQLATQDTVDWPKDSQVAAFRR